MTAACQLRPSARPGQLLLKNNVGSLRMTAFLAFCSFLKCQTVILRDNIGIGPLLGSFSNAEVVELADTPS
jgi:hypothetical protein